MKRKKDRADFWAEQFAKVHLDKQKEAKRKKGKKTLGDYGKKKDSQRNV